MTLIGPAVVHSGAVSVRVQSVRRVSGRAVAAAAEEVEEGEPVCAARVDEWWPVKKQPR